MTLLSRQRAYAKIESLWIKDDPPELAVCVLEDRNGKPEEIKHRKAQFLIRKMLEKADGISSRLRRHLFLGLRLCRLKVKIGKRLKKPRKRVAAMFKKISRWVKYLEALIW